MFRLTVLIGAILASKVFLVAGAAAEEMVHLVTVEGETVSGRLLELNSRRVVFNDGQRRMQSTDDLLRLRIGNRFAWPVLHDSVIVLANGDRLVARPAEMTELDAVAHWSYFEAWTPVKVPLETIRGVAFDLPESRTLRSDLMRTITTRRGAADALILKNGDQVAGTLEGLADGQFTFETTVGARQIPVDGVRALSFSSELTSFPEATGRRALLTLVDGSRITVTSFELQSDGQLQVDALFGARLQIPLTAVATLQFLGGRAVYLSDLEPAEYAFTPYLSLKWELARDRNVTGGPLRLGGVEYAKGLGMHSQSRATYTLDGQFRRFRATVGLDDEARKGSAVVAVEIDGRRIFTSGDLSVDRGSLTLEPIDVTGAQRLTLLVDFGKFADIQDHVNWCDAVLVK